MAQGPFRVDPNSAREISPASQSGGFTTVVPASDLAAPVSNLLGTVAQTVASTEKAKQQEDLRGRLGAIQTALQAGAFPDAPEGSLVTAEGMVNPANVAAIKELERLKNAALQGKLPQFAAVERANVILNEAIAAAPEWREELTSVARSTMGYTPQLELTRQVIELQQGRAASAASLEKEEMKARLEGFTSLQEKSQFNRTVMMEKLQRDRFEDMLTQGKYDANTISQSSRLGASAITADVYLKLGTALAGNQKVDAAQESVRIAQAFNTAMQADLERLPKGTDQSIQDAIVRTYTEQRDTLTQMVRDADYLKMLQRNNTTLKEIFVNTTLNMADVGPLYAMGGWQAVESFVQAVDILDTTKLPPEMLAQFGVRGAGVVNNKGALFAAANEALLKFQGGKPPANRAERTVGTAVATGFVQQNTNPELRAKGFDMLTKWGVEPSGSQYGAIGKLAEDNTVVALRTDKQYHGPLINLYQAELARLQQEYDYLNANGLVPDGGVKVSEGKMVSGSGLPSGAQSAGYQYGKPPQPQQGAQYVVPNTDATVYPEFTKFVRKLQNLNNYGKKYQDVAILTPDMYGSADALAAKFNTREKPGVTKDDGSTAKAPSNVHQFINIGGQMHYVDPATGTPVPVPVTTGSVEVQQ